MRPRSHRRRTDALSPYRNVLGAHRAINRRYSRLRMGGATMTLTGPMPAVPSTTDWADMAGYGLPRARAASHAQTSSVYERYAAQYADFRSRACPDDRIEGVAALDLARARHVAEVGCGPGYYAPVIAARHPAIRVTGIDASPAQIALARRHAARQGMSNTRFVCDDVCALSQPDGCFDRIIASRLFMVVHDCRRAMAELRACSRQVASSSSQSRSPGPQSASPNGHISL